MNVLVVHEIFHSLLAALLGGRRPSFSSPYCVEMSRRKPTRKRPMETGLLTHQLLSFGRRNVHGPIRHEEFE